ncbi:MAG: 2OG-Fe(II) oxygenase [Proteobacteria bacterium]|nr:2OG-Fe(II) oxygenase [Pseudomonadota bacterium]
MSDARKVRLPHYLVREDFLAPDTVADILDFVLANEALLKPTKVGNGNVAERNSELRSSKHFGRRGPVLAALEAAIRPMIGELFDVLRMRPLPVTHMECDLVVHGDGDFYKRHVDTKRAADSDPQDRFRLITGVYYLHVQPRAFDGGALRLHELGTMPGEGAHIDIAPRHNSIVFFPSWMPHEVMPVCVPSGRYADSRFSINCWIHGQVG